MVNFPTFFKNLKPKVYKLDVGKLKSLPINLKKLSDLADDICAKLHNLTH